MLEYLVSCPRNREKDACIEARYLFKCIELSASCKRSRIPGLVVAKCETEQELTEINKQLRELLEEEAYGFHFVLKLTPIEKTVPSSLEAILQASSELKDKINPEETFKIEVQKRFSSFHSAELIKEVADLFNQEVNLTKPDKVVVIQVMGERTGISVLRPEDIISVVKMKR